MFDDPDALDLTAAIVGIAAKHKRQMRDMEFKHFMGKINDLTHDQRVELFNALAERLAGG